MPTLANGLKTYLSSGALAALAGAKVGIAGAGGLGSNVAMLLTRCGVRRFVVADGDTVETSNLNRQFYWPSDVGTAKVVALRKHLAALEPAVEVEAHVVWLEPAGACALFAGCDVVVEALDGAALKAALCAALLGAGFFVVAASGIGGIGGPAMETRRLGSSFVCVGDFSSAVGAAAPPLAPRVMQAAAMQADAVLEALLAGRA